MLKKILLMLFMASLVMPLMAASKTTTIAITLIADHPALTSTYAGIMEKLKEHGFIEGTNLTILYADAHNNVRLAEQIAQDFIKHAPDVLVPISTPSASAIVKADKEAKIPVVFSAVTDPIAAQLVSSLTQPGGYVTGVYDFPPIAQQVELIRGILPNIKTLGVVYNPAEINSVRMIEEFKKSASSLNIIEAHVANADEIAPATRTLLGKVGAIYIPADNTVTSEIHRLLAITDENKIPVFTSEPDSVARGALASWAYDQFEVGKMTAEIIVAVLAGKKPGTIDIIKPANAQLTINTQTAEDLKLQIPETILKGAKKVVGE